MQSNGIGGGALQGNSYGTGITGAGGPPYHGGSTFGDAIAGGRGAGHKTTYADATQQTLSVPIFVRPWGGDPWHTFYVEGTLLFSATGNISYGNIPLETLVSVPLLNYLLDASVNNIDTDEPLSLKSEGMSFLKATTPEEFMDRFHMFGVVRNELATDGKMVFDPYGPTHQRLVNCDVGGWTRIPNIFAPSVAVGKTLWLVLKKQQPDTIEIIKPNGTAAATSRINDLMPTMQLTGAVTNGELPVGPEDTWVTEERVVGTPGVYLDRSTGLVVEAPQAPAAGGSFELITPPATGAMVYKSTMHRPVCIKLGVVKDTCRHVTADSIKKALRNHDQWSRQPRLGVFLGI